MDIKGQIGRLRVKVAYGPVGAQAARDHAADTMEKLEAVYEAAKSTIGMMYPITGLQNDKHDALEEAIAAVKSHDPH